jgi:hypothetical protein
VAAFGILSNMVVAMALLIVWKGSGAYSADRMIAQRV